METTEAVLTVCESGRGICIRSQTRAVPFNFSKYCSRQHFAK